MTSENTCMYALLSKHSLIPAKDVDVATSSYVHDASVFSIHDQLSTTF